ncbi:LOW QUALITY PROTEIN: E3 ubiquitin-protein ligase SH3RF2 [Diretmus argenteus]
MEELALLDLLECPLCFEQLDVSAKVLPCQHTFCTRCLQRRDVSNSQLLCPECRTPVLVRSVEELPANVLLVRLLEGLRASMGPGRSRRSARYMAPMVRDSSAVREGQQQSQRREKQGYVFYPTEMDLKDCKYLSFLKGDVLTVTRRVDEHWIEAKLGDKVGIWPLQFTELLSQHQSTLPGLLAGICPPTCLPVQQVVWPNSVAAELLEGKSRRWSDSTEFSHRTGSGGKDKATEASSRTTHFGALQVPAKTPIINALSLPNQQKQPSISSTFYQATKGQSTNISTFNNLNYQGQPHHFPATQGPAQPSRVTSQHMKRHSDSAHRHRSQGEKKMSSETPPTISMALVNPQMASASADSRNSSTQQLSISVCAALYSYKPRRPEELELRKGEMVGVYGKFKEGWLRGLSLRSGKVGILPGNYVTPVLRTSARLLENKAATASSSTGTGKRPTTSKTPTVVLALDRVNTEGTVYSTGQVPSVPNGAQHAMSSAGAGKSSLYGGSQGWDTVRRVFNPHRGSNQYTHTSISNPPSNAKHFAQVQASGYSPALQKKKNGSIFPSPGRPLGRMSEPTAPSAAAFLKDRDLAASQEAAFQHDRQFTNGPHSILVRSHPHKNNTDKPAKSVRFLTEEDDPPPRLRTSSWSSGNQVASTGRPGPPPLEVWAPSLTLGRDGPGIILKEGKAPILRKGLETAISDLNSNPQKPLSSQTSLSAVSAQFSPSRHRVMTTYLAQMDSELSLLQGELVLVHRPRPDGRVLVTQESSGQTGLFHSSFLQALERLS